MSPPYEIRLIVHPQAEGYQAVWTSPQGQISEAFPLTLPLQPDDMAELRWYLETYIQFPGAGDRARAQRLEAQLMEWGKNLFDALFGTTEGVQVYNDLMNAEPPRLLTLGSNDPAVLAQPWELLRDRRGKSSPLVFQDVLVRRQLQRAKRITSKPLGLPLRVLLIVSRPADTGFIDPRNSIAPLLDAFVRPRTGRRPRPAQVPASAPLAPGIDGNAPALVGSLSPINKSGRRVQPAGKLAPVIQTFEKVIDHRFARFNLHRDKLLTGFNQQVDFVASRVPPEIDVRILSPVKVIFQ